MRRLTSAAFQGPYSFRRAARILISLGALILLVQNSYIDNIVEFLTTDSKIWQLRFYILLNAFILVFSINWTKNKLKAFIG